MAWDTLEEECLGEMNTQETRDTKEITDNPETIDTKDSEIGDHVDLVEDNNKANSETGECEQILGKTAETLKNLADTADHLPLDEITEWQDANTTTTTDLADTTDLDSERELLSDTETKDANTADGTDKLECLALECSDQDFPRDTAWDSLEECILEELDTLEDTKITETDMADLDNNIPGMVKRNLKVDNKDTLEDSLPTGEANPSLGNARKDFPEDTEWEFLEE